jgi:hypothetical protein
MDCRFGRMVQDMKVHGLTTKRKVEALSGTLKAIHTQVNLKTIKRMGMVPILMSMALSMKAIGCQICKKGKVVRNGMMEHPTLDTIKKARSMDMVSTIGSIPLHTKESGMATK